eukprot:jgi/Tetstr1/448564/TSEL_003781.t1
MYSARCPAVDHVAVTDRRRGTSLSARCSTRPAATPSAHRPFSSRHRSPSAVSLDPRPGQGRVGGTRLRAQQAGNDEGSSAYTQSLEAAYEACRAMTAEYAKTFYFATAFQPRDKARSIFAIYAWCRTLDERVDGAAAASDTPDTLEASLAEVEDSLARLWGGDALDGAAGPEELALLDTVRRTPGMSIEPFQDMVRGMRMDLRPSVRYNTFEELYVYCYRVAGTVGLMTIPVLGTAAGVSVEEAEGPGVALGIALQLTNILRDVGEDAARGRIYLPLEDMAAFGVSEADIMAGTLDGRYAALMEYQIQRALAFYAKAEAGVAALAPSARLPVLAALGLYRRILLRVRDNGYDNFRQRAFTSKGEKLRALPGILWQVATGKREPAAPAFWLDLAEPRKAGIHSLLAAAALDDEGAVEAAAEALAECNPTPLPAASDLLAGKWQLLWSSPGSDYSRLREKLRAAPLPVPSASMQAIGDARSQNIVRVGPLQVTIDAAIAYGADDSAGRTTLVGPPYTFKLGAAWLQVPLRFPPEFGQERTAINTLYVDPWLKVSRVGAFGERTTPGSLFVHLRADT